MILVLSTHKYAVSNGPHILVINTTTQSRSYTMEHNGAIPNMMEFDLEGFVDCLHRQDIESVSIVPGTSDEWMPTAVVTLAYDTLGHVALLTQDVDTNFIVDRRMKETVVLNLIV